jgi:Phasin protein
MPPIDMARPAPPPPAMNSEMIELCQPIVEGMTQYGSALCDGYAAMGAEWLSFVNRRFHVDMSLAGRLANCGSPQALMQEWSTFMTTAAEDYRNEFTRLAEMNSTASQRAISAVHTNGSSK